jgi:hydrogenase/urease accessory protein HupE
VWGKKKQKKKRQEMEKMKMAKMQVGLFVMLLYLHSNRFTKGEVSPFSGLDHIEAAFPFSM